jgi:hypothetical protein
MHYRRILSQTLRKYAAADVFNAGKGFIALSAESNVIELFST